MRTTARSVVLAWAEQGHIAATELRRALAAAGALPTRADWQRFIDQLLLWMGVLLVAAGLIFFLAFNWNALDRFAKFALAEGLIAIALGFVWRLGVDRTGGKAALVAASLFAGALLALIGQTYQTGADSFELFGAWAVLILPWAVAGRLNVLWLLWLLVANLGVITYFETFPGLPILFGGQRTLWAVFALNTAALIVWEVAALRVDWLRPRWAPRLVAIASGGLVTALAIVEIVSDNSALSGASGTEVGVWARVAWAGWLAAAVVVYRGVLKDLFVLAGGVLSVIVVVTAFLLSWSSSSDSYLLVGLVVIALAGAGGMWLRSLTRAVEA